MVSIVIGAARAVKGVGMVADRRPEVKVVGVPAGAGAAREAGRARGDGPGSGG